MINSNTVVGSSILIGADPVGVATDTVRGRAYVTSRRADTASVIDTNTNKVAGTPIHVGKFPIGVARG
jgi:YVTN family beta-propeller protein